MKLFAILLLGLFLISCDDGGESNNSDNNANNTNAVNNANNNTGSGAGCATLVDEAVVTCTEYYDIEGGTLWDQETCESAGHTWYEEGCPTEEALGYCDAPLTGLIYCYMQENSGNEQETLTGCESNCTLNAGTFHEGID